MPFLFCRKSFLQSAVVAFVALTALPASAQVLSFSLVNNSQQGNAGSTLTYRGTFTNNLTDNLYLNSLYFNDTQLNTSGFTTDTSLFYTNLGSNLTYDTTNQAYFLAGGQTKTFDIFTVSIAAGTAAGTTRTGTVAVGGGGPSENDQLAEALATAGVLQPVPAPPAWATMPVGMGIAGLVGMWRKRKTRRPLICAV